MQIVGAGTAVSRTVAWKGWPAAAVLGLLCLLIVPLATGSNPPADDTAAKDKATDEAAADDRVASLPPR